MRRGLWGGAVIAALILTGTAFAQDDTPAPPADEATAAVDFQRILDRYLGLEPRPVAALPERLEDWRKRTSATLDELIAELDGLVERSGAQPDVLLIKALCHARRARIVLDRRRELDKEYDRLKELQRTAPADDTNRQLSALAGPRLALAEQVADEYTRVSDVLARALRKAERIMDEPEANLIRGVVLTQSAIVNDRALEASAAAGAAGVANAGIEPRKMRALLDQAQQLLTDYLKGTPKDNGLEWIRGQFYLGVVEYRRSLVDRVAGEEYFTKVDISRTEMFNRAREIFGGLSNPTEVLATLQGPPSPDESTQTVAQQAFGRSSFVAKDYSQENVANFYAASANLYLGLIASVDPGLDTADAQARLDAAGVFLSKALKMDASDPRFTTLTVDMIPVSVERVTRSLKEAAEAAPARKPLNDLTVSFGATTLWDTNVILLGRSTEAPLNRRRKRDFRVGALFKLNYVLDLDALSPGDIGGPLSKWQLLAELRTSPTWNARIGEFKEQFYGGTINLRYEIAGSDQIPNVDGMYFHARYDYDYILLDNKGFLRVNRVRPSFQVVAFDQVVDTSLYFSYEDRNYLEELRDLRFDRDGNYFNWGVDTLLDLGKWVDAESLWGKDRAWGRWGPSENDRDYRRPLEVNLGFEFSTNSTKGDQFDFKSQILTAGIEVPLPYGIDFATRGLFEWQDYRGRSLVDNRRRGRKDFIQEYGFRLQRAFYLSHDYDPRDYEFSRPLKLSRTVMTLSGDIRFIIDDSNTKDRLGQHVFEYNRIIYGAGVRFDID